jgi:hypothetical protein
MNLNIFEKNNIAYNWKTICVGKKLGLLDHKEVESYAIKYLEGHPTCVNPYITEIAYGVKEIELENLLTKVIKM